MSKNPKLSNIERMKIKEAALDHADVKKQLKYYPEHGLFVWRIKKGNVKPFDVAGSIKERNGYVYICLEKQSFLAHRLAWFYVNGVWPSELVDHKDNDRGNFIYENLRKVSHEENSKNQALAKNNKSGIQGVNKCHRGGSWRVGISHNKKQLSLGSYKSKIVAAYVRWQAEIKYNYLLGNDSSAYKYLHQRNRLNNIDELIKKENNFKKNRKVGKNNKSGVKGVSVSEKASKNKNKFMAYICKDSKNIHLGFFFKLEDAVKARYNAEVKFNGAEKANNNSAYKWLQNNQG